jgi:hypothetical protein
MNWLCVPSVGRMKLLYICSFSVMLLVVFGVLLEVFLELNYARTTFGRLWLGFTLFCLVMMICIWLGLLQFAGQSRKLETK